MPRTVDPPVDPYGDISENNPYHPHNPNNIVEYDNNPIDVYIVATESASDMALRRASYLNSQAGIIKCYVLVSMFLNLLSVTASWAFLFAFLFGIMGYYGASKFNRGCFGWYLAWYGFETCLTLINGIYLTVYPDEVFVGSDSTDSEALVMVLYWVAVVARLYLLTFFFKFFRMLPYGGRMTRV